ncbi:MAG: hypothetical protein P4L46_26085 [Fimbriimonas sp.]|nr:hypothetical protein [Fimbriimonas sp.]
MNNSSLSKVSLVVAAIIVVAGGTLPQKALASNTGTLPVIVGPKTDGFNNQVKDNGSLPVIINPSNPNPTGDGSHYGNQTYTVTVTISDVTTSDQVVNLSSSNPELVSVDAYVVVPAGSTSATASYTIPYSHHRRHQDVTLTATANGGSVSTDVHVHYHNEEN